MALAATVRRQVEAALEQRIPGALTPAAKVRGAVHATGVAALDELLGGGVPEGALSELVGPECSGRTAVALSFVSQRTREGKVCAWIDVSDALDPVSAAAGGVDLRRMLWVRCGVSGEAASRQRRFESGRFKFQVPEQYLVPPVAKKGLHGGGCGGHPRNEVKGLSQAVDGFFEDAMGSLGVEAPGRGNAGSVIQTKYGDPSATPQDDGVKKESGVAQSNGRRDRAQPPKRPWGRMEQAMRAADLLLQAGGFAAVVIDMGGLAPEVCSRVPLATWFRYRAAAERTRTSVVLLTQVACAKSSAEVVLRMEGAEEILAEPTLFAGMRPGATCGGAGRGARRRHEADCEASEFRSSNVVLIRKPPQPLHGANALHAIGWESRTVASG
jgi:hypothetical protein